MPVFRTEHAHKAWRPTFFEVRVLRTQDAYSFPIVSRSKTKIPTESKAIHSNQVLMI